MDFIIRSSCSTNTRLRASYSYTWPYERSNYGRFNPRSLRQIWRLYTSYVYYLLIRTFFELFFSYLDTTRPPRDGETDGAVGSYYFIDKEEMKRQKELGYFFEVGIHNENLYG